MKYFKNDHLRTRNGRLKISGLQNISSADITPGWSPGCLSRAMPCSSELVGADRGVEKKLVAIKINYMHRNAR